MAKYYWPYFGLRQASLARRLARVQNTLCFESRGAGAAEILVAKPQVLSRGASPGPPKVDLAANQATPQRGRRSY